MQQHSVFAKYVILIHDRQYISLVMWYARKTLV